MGHKFSRQALHELVWSEPRTVLAARLGVSDTGLAKACAKAGIPMPARGYWARVAAGKLVVKVPLPRRAFGQSDLVQVGTQGYRQAGGEEGMAAMLEPFFDEPVEAVRARAEALLSRCRVPRGLQAPHRLVAGLLDEDAELRKSIETHKTTWRRPRFDSPLASRRLRIVNALFIAMEHVGSQASIRSQDLDKVAFLVGDTVVGIEIEASRRKAEARRDATMGPGDRVTLKATGWSHLPGVPSAWAEADAEPFESWILGIARDLLVMGELAYRTVVLQQHQWRLERRLRLEAEAREARERMEREERERRLRQEAERLEWLLRQATNRRQADEIRALVRATDARYQAPSEAVPDETYSKWRRWALVQADLLDPCLGSLATLVGPAGRDGLGGLGEKPRLGPT